MQVRNCSPVVSISLTAVKLTTVIWQFSYDLVTIPHFLHATNISNESLASHCIDKAASKHLNNKLIQLFLKSNYLWNNESLEAKVLHYTSRLKAILPEDMFFCNSSSNLSTVFITNNKSSGFQPIRRGAAIPDLDVFRDIKFRHVGVKAWIRMHIMTSHKQVSASSKVTAPFTVLIAHLVHPAEEEKGKAIKLVAKLETIK